MDTELHRDKVGSRVLCQVLKLSSWDKLSGPLSPLVFIQTDITEHRP